MINRARCCVDTELREWIGILARTAEPATAAERKFYSILSLGRLGFHASFPESVELATKYGFEGLDPDAEPRAHLLERNQFRPRC